MVFMVIRPDTHGGMSIRAMSHELAAVKAMKYRSMKGAGVVEVRRFCGPAGSSDPVIINVWPAPPTHRTEDRTMTTTTLNVGDRFRNARGSILVALAIRPDHVLFSVDGHEWKCRTENFSRFVETGHIVPIA